LRASEVRSDDDGPYRRSEEAVLRRLVRLAHRVVRLAARGPNQSARVADRRPPWRRGGLAPCSTFSRRAAQGRAIRGVHRAGSADIRQRRHSSAPFRPRYGRRWAHPTWPLTGGASGNSAGTRLSFATLMVTRHVDHARSLTSRAPIKNRRNAKSSRAFLRRPSHHVPGILLGLGHGSEVTPPLGAGVFVHSSTDMVVQLCGTSGATATAVT
jgi:hypothetical protein